MLKRIALLTTAAILILIPILLSSPTNYQITIYNTNYYEDCARYGNDTQNQCKTIEPPINIVKSEPFISAWWDKTQIERQFSIKEVSTKWIDRGAAESGNSITRVLSVSIILFELLIFFGLVYIIISTLIKAWQLKGRERIVWICLIIFIFPLGSIIFALTKPQPK